MARHCVVACTKTRNSNKSGCPCPWSAISLRCLFKLPLWPSHVNASLFNSPVVQCCFVYLKLPCNGYMPFHAAQYAYTGAAFQFCLPHTGLNYYGCIFWGSLFIGKSALILVTASTYWTFHGCLPYVWDFCATVEPDQGRQPYIVRKRFFYVYIFEGYVYFIVMNWWGLLIVCKYAGTDMLTSDIILWCFMGVQRLLF